MGLKGTWNSFCDSNRENGRTDFFLCIKRLTISQKCSFFMHESSCCGRFIDIKFFRCRCFWRKRCFYFYAALRFVEWAQNKANNSLEFLLLLNSFRIKWMVIGKWYYVGGCLNCRQVEMEGNAIRELSIDEIDRTMCGWMHGMCLAVHVSGNFCIFNAF